MHKYRHLKILHFEPGQKKTATIYRQESTDLHEIHLKYIVNSFFSSIIL